MQNLLPVSVRRLRIAAARLRGDRRPDPVARSIWTAARNYRRDATAAPEDAPETIRLPYKIVDRIHALTPELDTPTEGIKDEPDHPNAGNASGP